MAISFFSPAKIVVVTKPMLNRMQSSLELLDVHTKARLFEKHCVTLSACSGVQVTRH